MRRYGSEQRHYRPDFVVRVDDGRGEGAKVKKETMDVYWVPGVNNLGTHGRWAFAEFTDVYQMQDDFAKKVEAEFETLLSKVIQGEKA